MSLTVVTDTDVAAIPFAAAPTYSFRLDAPNKQAFAGWLPLSHVLDPAKEQACIESLTGQFKHLPHDAMRDSFLHHRAAHQMFQSIMACKDTAAREAQIQAFTACLDAPAAEATQKLLSQSKPQKTLFKEWRASFENTTSAQKDQLVERIREALTKHNLDVSTPNINQGTKFGLAAVDAAQTLVSAPAEWARRHYDALKAEALRQGITPGVTVETYQEPLARALTDCPEHVLSCAQADYRKLAIIGDGVNVNDIAPGHSASSGAGSRGVSTSCGVYIKASALKDGMTVPEEIIHEVEGQIVKVAGRKKPFSHADAWLNPTILDTKQGAGNQAFEFVVEQSKAPGWIKGNHAIGAGRPPLKLGNHPDDLVKFRETVPDLYHLRNRVKKVMEKSGALTFDGRVCHTADDVMHAAFPNAWPMLTGPEAGMRLIQDAAGKVEQIHVAAPIPQGKSLVGSLKEYCEEHLGRDKLKAVPSTQKTSWMTNQKLAIGAAAVVVVGVVCYVASQWRRRQKDTASQKNQDWAQYVASDAHASPAAPMRQ